MCWVRMRTKNAQLHGIIHAVLSKCLYDFKLLGLLVMPQAVSNAGKAFAALLSLKAPAYREQELRGQSEGLPGQTVEASAPQSTSGSL